MFVVEDTKLVDYQCQPLDVTCHLVEGQANWLSQLLGWLAEHILDVSITDSKALDAAFDSAGVWLGLSIMVMVCTSIIGIVYGAVLQRGDLVKRAIIGSLLSLPVTMFAFRAVYEVLKVTDAVSAGLLNRLTGTEGISVVVGQVMETRLNPIYRVAEVNSQTGIAQGILLLLIFTIAMLFIAVAFAFRDFIVLLLIAFAPLAFVLLPAAGGEKWVKRWVGAMTAAILTKPLMLGALSLVSKGLSEASFTDGQTLAWIIGALMVSFMPIMAFGFFNFITSDAGSGAATTGANKLAQAPTRVTAAATNIKRLVTRAGTVAAPPAAAAAAGAMAAKNAAGQGMSKLGNSAAGSAGGGVSNATPGVGGKAPSATPNNAAAGGGIPQGKPAASATPPAPATPAAPREVPKPPATPKPNIGSGGMPNKGGN